MQCNQFEHLVEEQSEDPLPVVAALHLQGCPGCRLLWDDLEAIHAAGRAWGADDPAPPDRVWTALRAQLEADGLIKRVPAPAAPWFPGWFGSAPRLAIAGAYLSVLLIAATLVSVRIDSFSPAGNVAPSVGLSSNSALTNSVFGPRRSADAAPGLASPAASVADLSQTLDGDMKRVMASLPERNPSLATSLQHNLGIVDNLIAVCEKSVREQPDDPLARQYLYGAYQQKAVLLATAMDRSTLEDR